VDGPAMLAMLALMTTPIPGLRVGAAGRGWAEPHNSPPSTKSSPNPACFEGGFRGWTGGGSAMRPMREKKPQAMLAMGGRVGAPPPQTAPLSPYTRPVHTRHSGGCWWGLGVGIGAQYTGFFSACRPNFFFFFVRPAPLSTYARRIFSSFFF